eukprot:6047723-Pyramimonas_sp.AAC.1
MTKQERIIHTTRELNSTVHIADVTIFLRLIRAAGRRGGMGGSGAHAHGREPHLVKTGRSGRPRHPARL